MKSLKSFSSGVGRGDGVLHAEPWGQIILFCFVLDILKLKKENKYLRCFICEYTEKKCRFAFEAEENWKPLHVYRPRISV
jgi:hypothetical protein